MIQPKIYDSTACHSFNVSEAVKYGTDKAIILYNIRYWLGINRANNKNVYDGCVWTYNSVKAFSVIFPYIKEKRLHRLLKELEDEGVLKSGNYNKLAYDRTKWYTITGFVGNGSAIPQNEEMDIPKIENANSQSVQPIPDINTDINTDTKEGGQKPPTPTKPNKSISKSKNTTLPDDFLVTDKMQEWFLTNNLTVDIRAATEQWADSMTAKGTTYKCWASAWRNGMRNANKWANENKGASNERDIRRTNRDKVNAALDDIHDTSWAN